MINKVFRIGKIKISVHTLVMLLFFVFFVTKELRAFRKTSVEGGIWNYIQLLFVLIGVILIFVNFSLFVKSAPFWFLLTYSFLAMLNSLLFVQWKLSSVFDYILLPYALCIFVIAASDAYYNNFDEGWLLLFAFYTMTGIYVINMVIVGSFSTGTGATTDVYYILGLLPVAMVQTRIYKIIPLTTCSIAVVLSGKRTGIIIMVIMLLGYFIHNIISSRKIKTQFFYLMGLVIVVAGFVLIFNFINNEFNQKLSMRMMRIWNEQDSSGRFTRWNMILSAMSSAGLRGWVIGHGNNGVFSALGGHAHNDFLEVLYDFGLIPFLCYIGFWISSFVELVKMFRSKYVYVSYYFMGLIFSLGLAFFSFFINDPSYVTSGMLCLGYFLFDYKSVIGLSTPGKASVLNTAGLVRVKT